ncbi:MAG: hypothetical protein AAFU85_00225 [Planctomycetota bacterium]
MVKLKQHDCGSLENLLDIAEDSKDWFNAQIRVFAAAAKGRVYHGGASTKREKFEHEKKDANGARVNVARSKMLSRSKAQRQLGTGGDFKKSLSDKVVPSARAYQKAAEKGDYRFIKDVIRASVVFPDCRSVIRALDLLKQCSHFTPVEVKNNTESLKGAGYADINIIVVNPENGHLCELQLHFEDMLAAKSGGGHKAYNVERSALKGKSIGQVYAAQPHMASATSFGGGWVQNKDYVNAKTARMSGRRVYGRAINNLMHSDPAGYRKMQTAIRSLAAVAARNAVTFMASVQERDQKIAQGKIDPEFAAAL